MNSRMRRAKLLVIVFLMVSLCTPPTASALTGRVVLPHKLTPASTDEGHGYLLVRHKSASPAPPATTFTISDGAKTVGPYSVKAASATVGMLKRSIPYTLVFSAPGHRPPASILVTPVADQTTIVVVEYVP